MRRDCQTVTGGDNETLILSFYIKQVTLLQFAKYRHPVRNTFIYLLNQQKISFIFWKEVNDNVSQWKECNVEVKIIVDL